MSKGGQYVRKRNVNIFIFLAYVILGAYFINHSAQFIEIPYLITDYDDWIILAGGILMLFGAINYFRVKRFHH